MANIKSIYDNNIVPSIQYQNNVPIQIGVWFDGTPIWRVMFEYVLEDNDKSNKNYEVFTHDKFNDINHVFLLGGCAYVGQSTPCMIDDELCSGPYNSLAIFNWTSTNPYLERIYGYIDFVTAENNLRF